MEELLAFQAPENLFRHFKDYPHRNNMTQKDFVIGLIERELSERQDIGEAREVPDDTEEMEDAERFVRSGKFLPAALRIPASFFRPASKEPVKGQ